MSPEPQSPAAPPPGPPARNASPSSAPAGGGATGTERIVAVVLATMILVLAWVWFALRQAPADEETPRFDLTNPLLSAAPGDCVDVEDLSFAGEAQRVQALPPGPVLRPRSGPARLEGFTSLAFPDLREAPPYVACQLGAVGPAPAGAPATRPQIDLFDLNGFGMPAGTLCALVMIRPTVVTWNGQVKRRAYDVYLHRYDRVEGPWHIFFAPDVRLLGTMMREYVDSHGNIIRQRIDTPASCR